MCTCFDVLLPARRKGRLVTLFLLLCTLFYAALTGPLWAVAFGQGGVLRLFDEGNVLYQRNDFEGALEKYLQIVELGRISPALYYNIGNCFYKQGKIGKAILYYERALRLDPGDEDVAANLMIARQATIDKIVPPPEFALYRWYQLALHSIAPTTLLRTIGGCYVLLCILLALRITLRKGSIRRWADRLLLMLGISLIALVALGLVQWSDTKSQVAAIVMPAEVMVRSSPEEDAVMVFSVHEGTKVQVGERAGLWVEVTLLDGKVGWIPREAVEII